MQNAWRVPPAATDPGARPARAWRPTPKRWLTNDLGDGTVALRVADEPRYLVLTKDEAALAAALDGSRSVADVLGEVARTRRRVPYAQLYEVLSKLAGAGFLSDPPEALAAAGLPAPSRTGVRPGRRSDADVALDALARLGGWLLVSPLVVVVTMAVLAGTLVRDARLATDTRLLFPSASLAGSGGMAAFVGVLVVVLVRSWRGLVGGLAVKSAGREVLGGDFGPLGLQLDERDVLLAPRDDRLRVHLTLLASHLGFAALTVPLLEASGGPLARELARIVLPVSVISLHLALLPIGDGDLGRYLAERTGVRDLSTHARAYLTRKAIPRLVAGERPFAGDRLFVGLSLATVAWLVVGVAGAIGLARGALQASGGAMWAVVAAPYLLPVVGGVVDAGRGVAEGLRDARRRREGTRPRAVAPLELQAEVDALLDEVPVFASLVDDAERRALAERLTQERFEDGDPVVVQGAPGDAFYVVSDGRADVRVESDTGVVQTVASLGRGDSFGEVALLERVPRSATVVARGALEVLALSRADFEAFAGGDPARHARVRELVRLTSFLRRVEPFRDAPGPAMGWLVGRLGRERHGAGEVIVREGEVGDRFYVIERGGVAVAVGGQQLATLGEGDFFGEVALVQEVPRTATVTATGDVELLTLTRADFRAFLAAHLPGAVLLEETADRRRVEAAG